MDFQVVPIVTLYFPETFITTGQYVGISYCYVATVITISYMKLHIGASNSHFCSLKVSICLSEVKCSK